MYLSFHKIVDYGCDFFATKSLVRNSLIFSFLGKYMTYFFPDTVSKKHMEVIGRKHCLESDLYGLSCKEARARFPDGTYKCKGPEAGMS